MVRPAGIDSRFVLLGALLCTAVIAAPLTNDAKEIDKRRETTKEILKLESTLKKSAGENKHIFPSRMDAGDFEEQLQVDALEDVKRSMRLPTSPVSDNQPPASSIERKTEAEVEEKMLNELFVRTQQGNSEPAYNSPSTSGVTDEETAEGDDGASEYQWAGQWEEGSRLYPEEELSPTNPRWGEEDSENEYAYDGGYYGTDSSDADVQQHSKTESSSASDKTGDSSKPAAAVHPEDAKHTMSNGDQKSISVTKKASIPALAAENMKHRR